MDVVQKIIAWCIKHKLFALCMFLILLFIVPIVIFLFYDVFPQVIKTHITADGMLSYFGAVLGSIVALSIAIIGVYRDKKREEEAEDLRIVNRRRDINPNFYIDLQLKERDYFDLTITNCGKYIASDIYFIDRNVLPFIKNGQSKTIKICFDFTVEVKDAYYFEYELDGYYPKDILLIYSDIDRNLVSEKFKHFYEDGKHLYKSLGPEYEG